jgi:hypothetical protein
MACSELAHFLEQISIVLIAQRRHEAIIIATAVFPMATAAKLPVTGRAERQVFSVTRVRTRCRRQIVEVQRQIGPGLRLAHCQAARESRPTASSYDARAIHGKSLTSLRRKRSRERPRCAT